MLRCLTLTFLAVISVTAQDLLELSRRYTAKRDFEQAISTAQEYLKENPHSVPGRLVLGNAYLMVQRFLQAKQEAVEVLRMEPGNAGALEIKGNIEYLLGEINPAINTFIDLLERHPKNEDAPYMLGRIYYQEGRIDLAMGEFQRLLKLNAQAYKAYDNLGLCFQAKGDPETAIRYFLAAIKLTENDHPEYDSAYANLAELFLNTDNPEKAFDAAFKAARRNPDSPRSFYLGGKALEHLGKFDLSLNWAQRSAALDPNYAEAQYLLARLYRRLGQQDKAEEAQRKFLQVKAKNPGARR